MKKTSVFVLLLMVLSMTVGWHIGSTYTCKESITVDYDTVFKDSLVHDTMWLTGDKVRIPVETLVHDTVSDSVFILVDKVTKFYHDSLYDAWVSGIEPSLDSIRVYNKTITRTITKERRVPVAYTPKEKVRLQGFVGGYKSVLGAKGYGFNGGVELTTPFRLNVRAGYEYNDKCNYPYIGLEYIIR